MRVLFTRTVFEISKLTGITASNVNATSVYAIYFRSKLPFWRLHWESRTKNLQIILLSIAQMKVLKFLNSFSWSFFLLSPMLIRIHRKQECKTPKIFENWCGNWNYFRSTLCRAWKARRRGKTTKIHSASQKTLIQAEITWKVLWSKIASYGAKMVTRKGKITPTMNSVIQQPLFRHE